MQSRFELLKLLAPQVNFIVTQIKIDDQGCWIAPTSPTQRYPAVTISAITHNSLKYSRIMLYLKGELEDLLDRSVYALHKCDKPKCINPDCLFIGNQSVNMQDAVSKNRNFNTKKTHCKHGHEFTVENTYTYYDWQNNVHRGCRTCRTQRSIIRDSR